MRSNQGVGRGLAAYRPFAVAVAIVIAVAAFISGPMRAGSTPDAPTNVVAAAGDGEVSVSWLAPNAGDDGPIIAYDIQAILDPDSPPLTPPPTAPIGSPSGSGGPPGPGASGGPPGPSLPATWVYSDVTSVTFASFTNGATYRLIVTASNSAGYGPASAPSAPVTPRAGATTPQTTSEAVPPSGGEANTDPTAMGPTPADPVTTSVTIPPTASGGAITIAESAAGPAPTGFLFVGQQIDITSTAATDSSNPLTLVFRIDPSFVPATIFRNGVPVDTSCSPAGTANPSPCISSGAGTAQVTILTASASVWNAGIPAYAFTGFFSPVDNQPVVNVAKAGSAIPVKFGLGGDRGLTIFAPGYPGSGVVPCGSTDPVDGIEETVAPGAAVLKYDSGSGRYQYVWKSDKSWAGTCRQLVLKLRDGTFQRASFQFK
jgi:fibronectin type III domain protein